MVGGNYVCEFFSGNLNKLDNFDGNDVAIVFLI